IDAGRWTELVTELLERHYDPLYQRSQNSNFANYRTPQVFAADSLDDSGIARVAEAMTAGAELAQA
ncbi:MAG: hypothetical protein ACM31P_13665, partial [Actinomycetota bacterium]